MPSILLFGSTGLIGSHLVPALLSSHSHHALTLYNRNAASEVDAYFTALGVPAIVHGDFSEHAKISALSASHDIVINCGSSWDVGLSAAIVAGLRRRYEEGKGRGSLIHISGAGDFIDDSVDGAFKEGGKVFNDDNEDDMRLINSSMLNGGPDVEVLEAGKDGRINTYVIFPSGVYGQSVGPIKALGVIQLFMAMKAKELGFVPYVGAGTSIFNSVHVKDCASFILRVLDLALSTSAPEGSVFSRCYIVGGQNDAWKDVSKAFARLFHQKGLIDSPIARSVPIEEAGVGEMPRLMAKNMLFTSRRAEKLGYTPVQASLIEHLGKGEEDYSGFV